MSSFLNEIFTKKKSIAVVAAVSLVAFYEFNKIRVPKIIKNKFSYRVEYLMQIAIKNAVKFKEILLLLLLTL